MKKYLQLICLFFAVLSFSQKPIFAKVKVNAVNIYRTSAELQSSASFSLPGGSSDIVITNISDNVFPKSIQINSNNKNINILSVQYVNNYYSENLESVNPRSKIIGDSITLMNNMISKLNIERETSEKTLELLDKNQGLLVGSSSSSVAQLMQLTEYYKSKRTEISTALVDIYKKSEENQRKLDRLNTKLREVSKTGDASSKSVLLLKVFNTGSGNVKMDIGYLTGNVSWEPFYEVKGNKLSEPLDITFKAKVLQTTGQDWKGVKLSLINARSSTSNNAPVLTPWFLESFKNADKVLIQGYSKHKDTMRETRIDEVVMVGTSKRFVSKENLLNTSFDVDIPYDVLSSSDYHFITLKEIKVPVIYKYYTAPRQNTNAFLIARIKDFNQYNLIPGEASVIFENMYVGETKINPDQITDELSITLGDDKKISVRKEIVDDKSSTKLFSSYQEKTFTYDIIVRNNKKEAINIEMKDQIPLSKNEDVKVELLQTDGAELDKEKGFLTWNLKISASETKKIRISYKVRYPKDYSISNLN